MIKLTQAQENEIVMHVSHTFTDYKQRSQTRRDRMTRIYDEVSSFKSYGKDRETKFKVNKAHEIENRIVPRIMSKNPKPIVTSTDYDKDEETTSEMALAVQDRISEIYCKQDMIESLRLRAKAWVRYWLAFAKLTPKYRLKRTPTEKEWIEIDEIGNEIPVVTKEIKEEVYEQYTSIDIKSRDDMYFDPRYTRLEDMPSIIDISRNVRLSYFTKNKKKYMNIDKLIDACVATQNGDFNSYKTEIQNITGLTVSSMIKPDKLDVKCYYGYYDISDSKDMSKERLYEFWTVSDTILVYAKEISVLPYEDFRVFEDTESFYATGYLEPLLWLQEEMNWKKNRASEYVNQILKPNYIRSPASGIDPRKLNQWHGNIIATTRTWAEALDNLQQMPMGELHASYFQEQNDIERQFQAASFTINTNSPITEQSLTETATWAKIQSFETDAVTGETRKHFEESLVRLTYKLLQMEFDNMDANIKVKADKGYREINKEALRDAVERYEIKIQSGSSSYDSWEAKRNDALAMRNIALTAKQAWIPVNLQKLFQNVIETFPEIDFSNMIDQASQMQAMLWMQQPQAPSTQQTPQQI